jgi:hypothetical protein
LPHSFRWQYVLDLRQIRQRAFLRATELLRKLIDTPLMQSIVAAGVRCSTSETMTATRSISPVLKKYAICQKNMRKAPWRFWMIIQMIQSATLRRYD